MKALIVDDSETIRYLLNMLLAQHGYEVLMARHGVEGLDIARIHQPDFILSDILMPVMDGFRFLSALREDANIKHIPFIFFSGTYTDDKSIRLGQSLGADGFIKKSDNFENFIEELNILLKSIAGNNERTKPELADGETEFLEKYVEIMAVKLEKKVQELEDVNKKIQSIVQSYEYLFNSIMEVIVVTDNEQCIKKCNMPIFYELFGYSENELNGEHVKILFVNESDYKLLEKAVFNRKEYVFGKTIETDFRKKNGDIFRGEIKAMKYIGEYGLISGDICMIRAKQ